MGKNKTHPTETTNSARHVDHEPSAPHGEDYGEKFHFEADFQGPVHNRSCTDVICLVLFLVFLGGWAFVAYIGFSTGDIDKVGNSLAAVSIFPGMGSMY